MIVKHTRNKFLYVLRKIFIVYYTKFYILQEIKSFTKIKIS